MARKNRGSKALGTGIPSDEGAAPSSEPNNATPLPVGKDRPVDRKQNDPTYGSAQGVVKGGTVGGAGPTGTGGTRPRARVGRPRNVEKEYTVVTGGQMVAWPTPIPGVRGSYEQFRPDDLLGRYGFRIYREMLHDDTIKACLKFKKVLVHGRSWNITPYGGKDALQVDKDIADFISDNFNGVDFNLIQREALSCLDYGFCCGEIIWEVKPYEDKGLRVMLKDVFYRDPEYIRVEIELSGEITQFRQISSYVPPYQIEIPPEKVLHVAYQGDFQNHYGWSDLRAAYRAWWSKKFVTQFWNVFLERFGSPMMAMKYPQGASDQLKAALQNILTGIQSKTDILVPEGVVIELIEATRSGVANYDEAVDYFDQAISKALLVPGLIGMQDTTQRAADSQSRLQLRILMKVANDLSQDLRAEINRKIIKQLVDFNFNDVKGYPTFDYGDYGEYESAVITDAVVSCFNAGMLDMDQDDVNYVRSILGLPIRDEGDEDEIQRPQPTPLGNPGQGMGGPGGAAGKLGGKGAGPAGGNKRAKKPAGTTNAEDDGFEGSLESFQLPEINVHINMSPLHMEAPISIHPPSVSFSAPDITINSPDIKMPDISLPDIHIAAPDIDIVVESGGKTKKVVRNAAGDIDKIVEI